MTLTLYLTAALLCTPQACHPALVGPGTPVGAFPITRRYVSQPGYGGDVLQFAEDDRYVWAIHRVWTGNPRERRVERLRSGDPAQRRGVTKGCVNVMPEVYEQLTGATAIEIRP